MSIHDTLFEFCAVVSKGPEEGEAFTGIREETAAFTNQVWPVDGDRAVTEYLSVPNHQFACTDLDYKRFSTEPLLVGAQPLHVFHILEVFSRTTPARYATVWLPLLDVCEAVTQDTARLDAIRKAREHLKRQKSEDALDTQMDTVMQNVLKSFPGLQGMVQQMMANVSTDSPDGGMGNMMAQIQGLLNPLLTQAAASAEAQDPALQPAIRQILSGFSELTQALGTATMTE